MMCPSNKNSHTRENNNNRKQELVLAQEAGVQQGYVQQDDLFFSQLTVRCAQPVWPEELPFVCQ